MFIRIIMKFVGIVIWTNFPGEVSAAVTGMDTLHQVFPQKTGTSQMRCINTKKN